jgi:toxin CptA
MSIAVSATVRASPLLRLAVAGLCAAVIVAGTLVAGGAGDVASVLMLAGGLAGAGCGRADVKPVRIDISGGGGIRLTVYQQLEVVSRAAPGCKAIDPGRATGDAPPHAGCAARLLPGSTLWPWLLLLRLRCQEGEGEASVRWLVVLPDSAAPDVRRRLAVAVRAIAARQ